MRELFLFEARLIFTPTKEATVNMCAKPIVMTSFIQSTDGLYVGWSHSGGPGDNWFLYEVEWPTSHIITDFKQPTKMKKIRQLEESEVAKLHDNYIMYWGIQMHPSPVKQKGQEPQKRWPPEHFAEDMLIVCRPSTFKPHYVPPEQRKHNTSYNPLSWVGV